MDERAFDAWLDAAAIGDRCVYHEGDLATDREKGVSTLPAHNRQRLARLADAVMAATEHGPRRVVVTQRRIGPGMFEYRATRVE